MHVPVVAPDEVDSVIALKLDGPAKALPGFLLTDNVPDNRLLAFDGEIHGGKVTYGDGKAGNYAVTGFSHAGDSITWGRAGQLRRPNSTWPLDTAPHPAIRPASIGEDRRSASLSHRVVPTAAARSVTIQTIGRVKLPAGEQGQHHAFANRSERAAHESV